MTSCVSCGEAPECHAVRILWVSAESGWRIFLGPFCMCRHYEPSPVPGADPAGEHTSSCNAVCRLPSRMHMPDRSSRSRSSGNKEIPVFCDVFTGCKPLNQRTVQLAPGSIVNIANVCVRLVKSGITDQTLQAVTCC